MEKKDCSKMLFYFKFYQYSINPKEEHLRPPEKSDRQNDIFVLSAI